MGLVKDDKKQPEIKKVPPAIQRLMDEVRQRIGEGQPMVYDRGHNKHNRSM